MLHIENLSTLKNFTQKNKVVVVDFYAEWCGPCKIMTPILDELAAEYLNDVLFLKIDVDAAPALAEEFGVMSIPTIKVFNDNKIVENFTGFQPKGKIKDKLIKYI